jgi:hypothetical protein
VKAKRRRSSDKEQAQGSKILKGRKAEVVIVPMQRESASRGEKDRQTERKKMRGSNEAAWIQ